MSILYLIVAIFLTSLRAEAIPPSIIGHWLYYKKIYEGVEYPEGPNATLRLHFIFFENGESHLYWWHEGLDDHCSRKAKFKVVEDKIEEEIIWVDPNNTADCSYDPDMQMGKKAKIPYFFYGEDFVIRFHIGAEPLDYIWKRIE